MAAWINTRYIKGKYSRWCLWNFFFWHNLSGRTMTVGLNQPLTETITYLLHGAESFWEANWFAASQESQHISRNPNVHYRTHNRPPPVSILGQPNPIHIPTSHLLEIHPNIIYPSTPRSPQWSLSFRFPHQDPYTPSPRPYAPHAQPIWLNYI